jgi:hypothetical protein
MFSGIQDPKNNQGGGTNLGEWKATRETRDNKGSTLARSNSLRITLMSQNANVLV